MFVTPGYAEEVAPAEGEAHTEVGHGNGAEKAVFPPFDTASFPSQLLWLAITFGLFYLFLKNVVMPRLAGIIDVRNDRIAQDLAQAGKMKGEADAAVAAYEQELAQARANANGIANTARDGARADADAERKRVEADLEKKLGEAEARIAVIKNSAMGEVGAIAEATASVIVSELGGGSVDKAALAAAVKAARG
jgi:F-type H+-transporting ATPase subunit b